MSKTVRELSEELGVSKTTINKLLKDESRQQYVEKVGNKFVISDEGVASITAHFEKSDSSKAKPKSKAKTTAKKEAPVVEEVAQDDKAEVAPAEDSAKVTELEAELEQAKAELEKTKEALEEKESELTQKDDKIDSLKDKVSEVKEATSSQKKSKPWWKIW
ncbi:hypothetical protein R4Y45_01800 [Holzapfeliella sp. He02]|uniref:V-SNARE coiled-coil homology domain-containing protein n=1 Tax=Holzapfeliella saturejae TaxID=3082953 RepID=A0ABU8SF06_9LACO